MFDEEDPWQEVKDKIDNDFDSYIRCEPMDSNHTFKVMEGFLNAVDSNSLRLKLVDTLNRPKPFSNFKYLISNSGKYRQQWFDFKMNQNIEWVKDQLLYQTK